MKDDEILKKIKKELNFGGNVTYRSVESKGKMYPVCELSIYSKEMVLDLMRLGINPAKSKNIEFPNVPEAYVIDFIRGYFDGNGTVGLQRVVNKNSKNDIPQIRVRINSGSHKILESMQHKLSKHGLKEKNVSSYMNNNFEIAYSTRESQIIFGVIYKNTGCMKLKRKYEKFKEIIHERNEVLSSIKKYVKVKINRMENDEI